MEDTPDGNTRRPSLFPPSSRNIFIALSGVSGQAESVERRAGRERGHVEPDGDPGVTL